MMPETPKDSLLGKIAAYTEILSTDPRSTIFVSLSETYRKMGMLDDAYHVAQKGLEHLADYCPGHVVLARVKCQQGDLDGSEESFRRALEIDPDSLAALVGCSRLYLLQERKKEAREMLLKARELSPADPVINKLLISLPEPEDSPAEVIAETTPVEEPSASPEPPTSEPLESATLAELYLKQGLSDKALNIYRNLLARDPDNLQLRRRIRDLEASLSGGTVSTDGSEETKTVESQGSVESRGETLSKNPTQEPLPVIDQLNRLLQSIQKRRGDV